MDRALLLLGVPRRLTPSGEVALPPGRAVQLAAFLAIRGDWVARDDLTALLWPDAVPQRARASLSQLLYALRRSPWGEDVETEPARVRWLAATDVAAFRQAAAEGDWRQATDAYGGPLLEGTAASSSDAFDAWLQGEREELRATWHEALHQLAHALVAAGHGTEAARHLRRLLADGALREDAVQLLVRCEARAGRRDAAL